MGTDNGLPTYHETGTGKRRKDRTLHPLCIPVCLGIIVVSALIANLWVLLSIHLASPCQDCPPAPRDLVVLGNNQLGPGTENSRQPTSILITIITSPRPNNERYLMSSLSSLRKEIYSSFGASVGVLVSNLRPGSHPVFDEAKEAFKGIFTFQELVPRVNPNVEWEGRWGKVSTSAYQLNLDFLENLISTQNYCNNDKLEYVLILEDDFEWCTLGFSHLLKGIVSAKSEPNWKALRFSYGNNGVLFRCDQIAQLIKFGEENKKLGPLDSLLGEHLTKPSEESGGPYLVYRHNLMQHIGTTSARNSGNYSSKNSEGKLCYPACYGLIQYVGLMPKENFNPLCLQSDFSPCANCGNKCPGISHSELMRFIAKRIDLGEC